MEYQKKSFSVPLGSSAYSANWDKIFKGAEEVQSIEEITPWVSDPTIRRVKPGDECTWGSTHACKATVTRIDYTGVWAKDSDPEYEDWHFEWSSWGTNKYNNLRHADGTEIDVDLTKAYINLPQEFTPDMCVSKESEVHNWSDSLEGYQRRSLEWSQHNFPLKVTPEHQRIATEFLNRLSPVAHQVSEMNDLARLLAARDHRSYLPLLGAVEELGELCHAHLKNEQGIRGTAEHWAEAKKDAVGDTLIYLLDYANKEGFSLQECLDTAWAEVSSRDWIRFPLNGKTE